MKLADIWGDYVPALLGGMVTNFEISIIALLVGMLVGAPFAAMRFYGGRFSVAFSATVISLMRAAPTFVVMFFLLNVLRDVRVFGVELEMSGVMTVAVSLVPYAAAYTADAGVEALRQWQRGSHLGALLFLPNITRAFFVIVMASGAAAAIGVPEGISVILREAALLPTLGDRLIVFAIGIALFGVPLQIGLALMRWLQRELGRRIVRPA
jgi:His/Glu/Gln/Arg/opine family amino acid ABC transporter permease subunit